MLFIHAAAIAIPTPIIQPEQCTWCTFFQHTHNKVYTREERTIMAAFRSISVLVFLPSVAYDSKMSTCRAHVLLTGQQQKMYMKIECLHIFIVSYFFTPPQNMMSRTKLKMITCNSTVAVVVWIERSFFLFPSFHPEQMVQASAAADAHIWDQHLSLDGFSVI